MELLIVSGLSGAGKSKAAAVLEDIGFYCVDNMPVVLMPKFVEVCAATKGAYNKVALVTDVRSGHSFESLFKTLDELRDMGCDYKIVFVEASLDIIIHRYKETRRKHPLSVDGTPVEQVAARERAMLEPLRERADYIIDTTAMSTSQLRELILQQFSGEVWQRAMIVNVISFGYKNGIPVESDLVFDVRFLPNPFYLENLRHKTGLDEQVYSFVFGFKQTEQFMKYLKEMTEFLLPLYMQEGKSSLVISIGCTGGHHRSVAIARTLSEHIADMGYHAVCNHRDLSRS